MRVSHRQYAISYPNAISIWKRNQRRKEEEEGNTEPIQINKISKTRPLQRKIWLFQPKLYIMWLESWLFAHGLVDSVVGVGGVVGRRGKDSAVGLASSLLFQISDTTIGETIEHAATWFMSISNQLPA